MRKPAGRRVSAHLGFERTAESYERGTLKCKMYESCLTQLKLKRKWMN